MLVGATVDVPTDPLRGLIPVPLKGCILLLTEPEYLAGIRRGKWWRRRLTMERRTQAPPTPSPDPTL